MFRTKASPEELEALRLEYDRRFASACLECCDALHGDAEIKRLAAAVLASPDLGEQAELYRRLEENVDRKLRAILAVREKGCRYEADPIRLVSHVCRKRGRLLVAAMITGKGGRKSRQALEVSIEGVK